MDERFGWVILLVILGLFGLFALLARLGGWAALAREYRFDGSLPEARLRFQSVTLRYAIGYTGCISIGCSESGLFVSVFFLFRLGHPNLFVPWEDVGVPVSGRFGYMEWEEFRFRREPAVPFRVSPKLGRWLNAWREEAAGS